LQWYQGYSEIVLIPSLRNISPEEFNRQVAADAPHISHRIAGLARESAAPGSSMVAGRVVVFPTGSGRQFIPLEWARENLPNAVFALHERDPDLQLWHGADLAVIVYSTPEQIAALGLMARVALTTDSFPSHVLQYSGAEVVVLITGTARFRVVAPGFRGQVVDAVAPCHPCPHLERRGFPKCKEGHEVCLNWELRTYTSKIMELLGRN
jgi:hypothetical protein